MSDLRYSELKYDGKTYTEQWQINEILIKNKFNWMVDAEIKNARLEIFQDTLVWNAGIWYNGSWYFGVWRDGEWRYGNWQNGVWYNGVWKDGTFKSGIIYNGKFFKGKIESGEIRGGRFIDVEISDKVIEYTSDEYQAKKQVKSEQPASGQTTTVTATATMQATGQTNAQSTIQVQPEDRVKVSGTKPPVQSIQQEKKNNNYNMKKLKTFESYSDGKSLRDLYDEMQELLDKAYNIIGNNAPHTTNNIVVDIEHAIEGLSQIDTDESLSLIEEIKSKDQEMHQLASKINSPENIRTMPKFESVGDPEVSFVDVNLDETELEDSDRPNLGKLKQKDGKIIIETPSKTDAYNAKMRLGGEVIVDPNQPDKQIHHVKKFNDFN